MGTMGRRGRSACHVAIVSILGALTAMSVPSVPASAAGEVIYDDVGYDGSDPALSGVFDIRSTTRRLERGEEARYLVVTVAAAGEFSLDHTIRIDARLDARGDPGVDGVVRMWMEDMSGSGCQLTTVGGRVLQKGRLRHPTATTLSCRVKVGALRPTKVIRWAVATSQAGGPWRDAYDTAPDAGMFG